VKNRAVILGATGLVGKHLLDTLLNEDSYDEILVIGRSSTGLNHPKLKEQLGDLLDDNFFKEPLECNHLYCCIGTTQSKTSDLAVYKHIDYGIPVHAATAGLKGGMQKFLVVSSLGANPKSKMFYSRTKGQMEETLRKMSIPRLHIFRPSLLLGDRDETRIGEKVGVFINKVLGWAFPAKYRGISAKKVATAMYVVANSISDKEVYESDEIGRLS
tara:strand:- start:670 stop:1314 length:645 start_codon:yes stop_codon:yes gene_type:complete